MNSNDAEIIYKCIVKLERKVTAMAVDLSKLQAAVAQLTTDVNALIALVPNPAGDAAVQAQVDAVATSLASLDAAVKTAETPPTPAAGSTGTTGP